MFLNLIVVVTTGNDSERGVAFVVVVVTNGYDSEWGVVVVFVLVVKNKYDSCSCYKWV